MKYPLTDSPNKQTISETYLPFTDGGIDDCRAPATVQLGVYWREHYAKAQGVPRYKDVELMDLYKIAHLLAVKDVLNGGEDFVNRYWGTELVQALGFEGTGILLSEYEPDDMRIKLFKRYRGVASSHQPASLRNQIEHLQHRNFVTYEVLHVPFMDPAKHQISQIVSVFQFNIPLQR